MSDIEATSQGYEVDYSFAPVGLFVCSFWIGSLLVGLIAFFFNCLAAKGLAPYIIDGQRSWFKQDDHGVFNGAIVMLLLFTLSVAVGVAGRMATIKSRKLDGLWKLSLYVIPLTVSVLAVASVFIHP